MDKNATTRYNQPPDIISYLTLRKAIGILGIALPVVVVVGALWYGDVTGILSSISGYYHTNMRDVFVGILCGLSLFMLSYHGYDSRDLIAGRLSGFAALGAGLFPCRPGSQASGACASLIHDPAISQTVHYVCAALLFLTFSYFSIFLFTRSDRPVLSKLKIRRNTLYRFCGILILCCVALIALYSFFLKDSPLSAYDPVFWLESIILWAFGAAWLVKGGTIWKDAGASEQEPPL